MKQLIVLGNWKANKTLTEAEDWIHFYKNNYPTELKLKVILCPTFIHLGLFSTTNLSLALGVQDISQFPKGAYTGEVSVDMVKSLVDYVLIGHSERRKYNNETDQIISEKVRQVLREKLVPVVCVSNVVQLQKLMELVPEFNKFGMLLYEPVSAIGSGKPKSPEDANIMAHKLHEVAPDVQILYGGSVKSENVASYIKQSDLSGVGVGGASLEAEAFVRLIYAADRG